MSYQLNMTKVNHILLGTMVFTLIFLCFQGCACLDDQLYLRSPKHASIDILYRDSNFSLANRRTGIFPLSSSPSMKTTTDDLVAQSLYDAILRCSSFDKAKGNINNCISRKMSLHLHDSQQNLEKIFEIASAKKYHFVIVVKIISSLMGSDLSPSHLSIQVRIFDSRNKNRGLLFYAKAQEYGNPVLANSILIIFKTKPKSAPTLGALADNNAYLIANAICWGNNYENNL